MYMSLNYIRAGEIFFYTQNFSDVQFWRNKTRKKKKGGGGAQNQGTRQD